ncbi:MAG: hypothetical protein Tsb0034_19890 [Ekhidna sp.]
MNVLIVDDEEDIGLMISVLLKKEGINAEFKTRVSSAKEMIERKDYSMFFLDLNLPDGTGFDLIPLIKKSSASAHIVVISAYDTKEEKTRAFDLGADLFIRKPFSKREIIDAFKTLTK